MTLSAAVRQPTLTQPDLARTPKRLRQSDLKLWMECPLKWHFARETDLAGEQMCAATFGTVIHHCILHMEQGRSYDLGRDEFARLWVSPELLDPSLTIDFYLPGRTWSKYKDDGLRILRDWWSIIEWEADIVLAREHLFTVPVAPGIELQGQVDKLALRYDHKREEHTLLVSDYKTSMRKPTRINLAEDVQFSAYAFATTQPEFWVGIEDGEHYFREAQGLRRVAEWVHLRDPVRIPAGERTERHYNRVRYALFQMAMSIDLGIFVPTISGESCARCPFRGPCGLPEVMEEPA